MPEGPEVETIKVTLEPLLVGQTVTTVFTSGKSLRSPLIIQDLKLLCGKKITRVNRHGKLLWLLFGEKLNLLFRLGMTGKLIVEASDKIQAPHTHLVLSLQNNHREFRYVDTRRFGEILLCSDQTVLSGELKKMGPDPLSWTAQQQLIIAERINKSKRAIKEILLDQNILAGVGNIYASESLFDAHISPMKKGQELTTQQVKQLLKSILKILKIAVKNCGTSFSDYVDGQGEKGQNINYLKVFQRLGFACPNCQTKISKCTQGGRSTFYCAKCQK